MRTNISQIRAQRDVVRAEANAALDAAIAAAAQENRGLSAEEQASQEAFNARLANLNQLLEADRARHERDAAAEAVAPVLDAGPIERAAIEVGQHNLHRDPLRGFRAERGFHTLAGGFDMASFALAVRAACRPGGVIDQRLIDGGLMPRGGIVAAPTNYHQETGTAEGAMVPQIVSQAIWALVFSDPLLDFITVEPTSGNSVDIIGDETTPWGAAGIVAKWRSEGGQLTPAKLETKLKQVRLHELYAFVLATDELLEDAPRLTERLNVKAPAAIRWKFAEALMFGTGAGQPLGWASDNYSGKVLQARTTTAQLKPDDLVKMFSRLLVQDGPDRSFWVTNRDTLPDLILRSIIGNVPVWTPPNGLAGAPNGTILGRPVLFSEHCQTLGTAGDIQLINPDGYYATQRGPARQDSSMHLFFDYAVTAFRWMFRFGGQPMLSAVIAAAKGSNSKSHFVVLNT